MYVLLPKTQVHFSAFCSR